jgi:hypothetical protein
MDRSQQYLPEERQFIGVLVGSCLIVGLFVLTFFMLTAIKHNLAPRDVTAAWFAAWGTWGAGLATASAFIIAAASVRVTGAHARADRRDAALVRESQDMAQARLLIIHEVDMPDQPQSYRFYRIDNRSKDLFFDVKVPFVERYYQSDAEIERLTPESAANTLEFLPDGVLLTPYRTRIQEEAWCTEVRVYSTPGKPVRFAVHYSDAAGLQWKQHLDGRIERVLTKEAVPEAKRKADVAQPRSPLHVMSAQESADVLSGRFPGDVPKEVQDAGMEIVAPMIVETWSRVDRVGKPHADPIGGNSVRFGIAYGPTAPSPWGDYFREKLWAASFQNLQFHGQGGDDIEAITFDVNEEDIARMIGIVDEALKYANDQFEERDLADARAAIERVAAAADRRAHFDDLVAQYVKPGRAPWEQPTPEPSQNQADSDEVVPEEDEAGETSPQPPSDA